MFKFLFPEELWLLQTDRQTDGRTNGTLIYYIDYFRLFIFIFHFH